MRDDKNEAWKKAKSDLEPGGTTSPRFKATTSMTDAIYLREPSSVPMARPCVLLEAGVEIMLPGYFDEKRGIFNLWSVETLDSNGAALWSLWMTAMAVAHRSAPELLFYIQALKPEKVYRVPRKGDLHG